MRISCVMKEPSYVIKMDGRKAEKSQVIPKSGA